MAEKKRLHNFAEYKLVMNISKEFDGVNPRVEPPLSKFRDSLPEAEREFLLRGLKLTDSYGIKQKTSLRFSRWSATYDRSILQSLVFNSSRDVIIGRLSPFSKNPITVLDVGCGTGEFAIALAKDSPSTQVKGVDISSHMIKKAQSKPQSGNVGFNVGDAEDLPYENEAFDVVTCAHSFHHYPNKEKALKQMYRVLKKNGRLMLVDGSKDTLLGKFIFGVVIKKLEKNVYHILKNELKEILERIGFTVETQEVFSTIPLLLTVGVKGNS